VEKYILKVYTNEVFLKENTIMKNLSLKLEEEVFMETEKMVAMLGGNRNRYINQALAHYNAYRYRLWLKEKLKKESAIVAADSMRVLAEFDALEDYDETF
jgi:hypothetical protein